MSVQQKTRYRQLHAGSGFSKWIMRVLLLSHCVPFADYRHHQQSGAAPIPVVVSEVCDSLMNARVHNSYPARAVLIPDGPLACQLNRRSMASTVPDVHRIVAIEIPSASEVRNVALGVNLRTFRSSGALVITA